MHPLLTDLARDLLLTGDLRADMVAFLERHGCPHTAEHSLRVAEEARRLAVRFGADERLAEATGWLHDISAAIPVSQRALAARALGLEVLPEEEAAPMILHQKLSVVIARDVFGLTHAAALSAIGCHTTLKSDATALDKVVFVADKIAWDQPGSPSYLDEVLSGLEVSLDQGALAYLAYLWRRRETLAVVHPWLVEAYRQLGGA